MSAANHDYLLVPGDQRPLATLYLAVRTGLLDDPRGKEGLAYLTGKMLLRGTERYSRAEIDHKLDMLGSNLGVTVAREVTTLSFDALERNLDSLQELVEQFLLHPTFPADELEKQKRHVLADLEQIREQDAALGHRWHMRKMFADHPYGRPALGNAETIGRIQVEDCRRMYEELYLSDRGLVAGCGALTEERLHRLGEATLGRLPSGTRSAIKIPEAPASEGWKVTLVDKPERSQTQVFLGHPTVDVAHPEHQALQLGNIVFGGTFTSRLSQEIREKRGWSYGVSSHLYGDRHIGVLGMRFAPEPKHAVEAVRIAVEMLQTLKEDGVTEEELDGSRDHLVLGHPMGVETPESELRIRASDLLMGRSAQWLDGEIERLQAISHGQVQRALSSWLQPENMRITVVCTASDLLETFQRLPQVDEVEIVDYMAP